MKYSSEQNSDQPFYHQTVLLEEAVELLCPSEGKLIIDGTLGGGGHSELLLKKGARVLGVDRDQEARDFAAQKLAPFGERFQPIAGNFANLTSLLPKHDIARVDGILVDIGVSSRQFDAAQRGFSFSKDGPLDMRMGADCPHTAAEIINTWDAQELARIFWQFGEERASRKIAAMIVERRQRQHFSRTVELAEEIERVSPRFGKKIHPATKVFQALRIEVNDELGALRSLLESASDLLNPGGRMAIISFHSLEDRMVKRFFKQHSTAEIDRPEWPAPRPNPNYHFNLLTKKPITASLKEIQSNPRSRSALLRGVTRL